MENADNNTVKTKTFALNKNAIIKMIYRFNFMNRWYIFAGVYLLLVLYHVAVISVGQAMNVFFIVFISVMYAAPILGLSFSFLIINRFLTKSDGRMMVNVCDVKIMSGGVCFFTNDNVVHFAKTQQICHLAEYGEYFLIFLSRNVFIPVPLSAFESGEKSKAIDILKAQNVIYLGKIH
ncbi:MAG: hypothetical protein II258_07465 [Spirochaetales bacterium]|nr:hypothetical protein [Spirochaetales bacterium]MBQ2124468.1 hypothetical protein [Spirochaetales bacterium]MBQ2295210.1 hypothetical protein [Spirochaetales bacterium]